MNHRKLIPAALLLLAAPVLLGQPIRLKAGAVARVPGRIRAGHVIVQFPGYPDAAVREDLVRRGLRVLEYVPDNALMVAAGPRADLSGLNVAWAGALEAEDKISPLLAGQVSGAVLAVFHADVEMPRARQVARSLGFDAIENPGLLPRQLVLSGPLARLKELAEFDEVAYLMPASADLAAGVRVAGCAGAVTEAGPVGEYALVGTGWPKDAAGKVALGYFIRNLTEKMDAATARGEIESALREWTKYSNVTMAPGTQGAARTIDILFASGAHGDGYRFDGPGGTLAHTFYPAPPNQETIAGDMHLDADEGWHAGSSVDLFSVALHEAGHALGLGHTDRPGTAMYPYYRQVGGLSSDDIAGIQALYGAPATTPTPPTQPTQPTPPTQPTQPTQPTPPTQPTQPTPDSTPPALQITSPGLSIVSTTAEAITIGGAASDNVAVLSVKWAVSTGGSGTASGTTSWSATVPLLVGTNVITVRAYDAAGNSAWRSLTAVRR
ncbi:MAG: matrixin family metalloprotease [Acidobacteria bacterium]|nr:matrixin family metalloprotease [Acidobacteriota bacterium]